MTTADVVDNQGMQDDNVIRVALVDDNKEFLGELAAFLEHAPETQVVGRFTTAHDALAGIPLSRPDVALVDLGLPDRSGIDVIENLSRNGLSTEFLVLTVYDDDQHLFPALKAGAVGYIVKETATHTTLIDSIREATQGGAPMSLGIARRVLTNFHTPPARDPRWECLSEREVEVLEYLAKGYHTKRVATLLNIAYGTVRCHQKNIYKKLHVNSLLEAVTRFQQPG